MERAWSRGDSGADPWRPNCPLSMLRARARLLQSVREFFAGRGVLEVDTPVLSRAATPAPYLESFQVDSGAEPRYLQTSPEFAMKRLLAAGSGPIFQVAKAFRREESGRHHNPEFSLLEWYRPGWTRDELMDEVQALVEPHLPQTRFQRVSYAAAFARWAGVDAHRDGVAALAERAFAAGLDRRMAAVIGDHRDAWLDQLLDRLVVPAMAPLGGVFLYDYPASQAALARLVPGTHADGPALADRFELFVAGIELANGFRELSDAAEQRRRFEHENDERIAAGRVPVPLDEALLAALQAGLPDCSGVALGLDRLLMLSRRCTSLDQVMAFRWETA